VPLYLTAGLAITNALVAASGALLAMYQGFSDVGMGQGILILALAGMTIGERVVPDRSLSIPGFVIASAVVGSLIYETVIAYAIRLGLAATDLKLATALFVLVVIAFRMRRSDDEFLEVIR
jgi:putative tryptophan/tyrosine transport system permease protein